MVVDSVEPFIRKLSTFIENLLSEKAYALPEEAATLGRKNTKEKLTFLACANASGN